MKENALKTIGHRIAKDTSECIRQFKYARGRCEHRSEPTNTKAGGCKHKEAYAKHPNLELAWCDYNVCPIIMAGMAASTKDKCPTAGWGNGECICKPNKCKGW